MRADFRTDAVLERRDDLAARRVVFRVGGKDQHHVEPQADRVALNLDVAFLQDVEEADLDFAGEVGQFVDGEDAAIGPRQQPVVHRQFVGEVESRLRRLDRVDVAHHVGDRHVRGRELLDVAVLAREPRNRQGIAFGGDARAAGATDRVERVVVNLAAGDDRNLVIQQVGEAAEDAALGLAAQAEQNEVVTRENRVHQLRDDRLVIPDHTRKERLAGLQLADQVFADFFLDRTWLRTVLLT